MARDVSAENPAEAAAENLVNKLQAASWTLVLAESCTAGLAADLIARIPGASRVLWGSFVTYTVDAKTAMLGLDRDMIKKYGAVSRETACAMAEGALEKSGAPLAAAVTGLAGPGGDGSAVPVGTVWIATALRGAPTKAAVFHYRDSRNGIRNSAALAVVEETLKRLHDAGR
ncbi:MAG: CinA family protein [Treponema sp.]|jgi:PncC family amidohydrolase|nr:CinA family protein [Treponema sp.]